MEDGASNLFSCGVVMFVEDVKDINSGLLLDFWGRQSFFSELSGRNLKRFMSTKIPKNFCVLFPQNLYAHVGSFPRPVLAACGYRNNHGSKRDHLAKISALIGCVDDVVVYCR